MPSRRNFLKGLAAGAVALGIGTVEAVKAAPVGEVPVEKSGYAVEQQMHRSYAEMRQSAWYQDLLRKQVLAQLSPMYIRTVGPASIYPVWKDGQLSEVLEVSPPVGTFEGALAAQIADALDEARFLSPQSLDTSRPLSFTPIYYSDHAIKAEAKISGLARYRDT